MPIKLSTSTAASTTTTAAVENGRTHRVHITTSLILVKEDAHRKKSPVFFPFLL